MTRRYIYNPEDDEWLPNDAVMYWQSVSGYSSNACMQVKPLSFEIEKVVFNDPATIVIWKDKTKTVVKCQEGDEFDPEKGLAMAIAKKALGNKSNFNNTIKRWTDTYVITNLNNNITAAVQDFVKKIFGAEKDD